MSSIPEQLLRILAAHVGIDPLPEEIPLWIPCDIDTDERLCSGWMLTTAAGSKYFLSNAGDDPDEYAVPTVLGEADPLYSLMNVIEHLAEVELEASDDLTPKIERERMKTFAGYMAGGKEKRRTLEPARVPVLSMNREEV